MKNQRFSLNRRLPGYRLVQQPVGTCCNSIRLSQNLSKQGVVLMCTHPRQDFIPMQGDEQSKGIILLQCQDERNLAQWIMHIDYLGTKSFNQSPQFKQSDRI